MVNTAAKTNQAQDGGDWYALCPTMLRPVRRAAIAMVANNPATVIHCLGRGGISYQYRRIAVMMMRRCEGADRKHPPRKYRTEPVFGATFHHQSGRVIYSDPSRCLGCSSRCPEGAIEFTQCEWCAPKSPDDRSGYPNVFVVVDVPIGAHPIPPLIDIASINPHRHLRGLAGHRWPCIENCGPNWIRRHKFAIPIKSLEGSNIKNSRLRGPGDGQQC